ncbi:MAG: hypothetical protein IJT02_03265 [Synergistaceae bacterium]|nr:hypothetical protein [Synergistaceae bacterium]
MAEYRIAIAGSTASANEALELTERIAGSIGLTGKEALRLRLLAEEMLNMVQSIAGSFSAEFWIEHEGKDCTLHLSAKSELDYAKRRELLSVSTSGRNTARLGIMEKIRCIFEAGLYGMEEGFALQSEYGPGIAEYGMLSLDAGMSRAMYAWSMQKYKEDVKAEEDSDAWDELEKSIIANIADEVSVGVRRDGVELTVRKNYGKAHG